MIVRRKATIPGLLERLSKHSIAVPSMSSGSGSGGDHYYEHDQALTTNVWTINHGLGIYPSVSTYDTEGQEIKGQVVLISENELEIHFNLEVSGKAYLN